MGTTFLVGMLRFMGAVFCLWAIGFALWEIGRSLDPSAPSEARIFEAYMFLTPATGLAVALVLFAFASIIELLTRLHPTTDTVPVVSEQN